MSGKVWKYCFQIVLIIVALFLQSYVQAQESFIHSPELKNLPQEYTSRARNYQHAYRVDNSPLFLDLGIIPPKAFFRIALLPAEDKDALVKATLLTESGQIVKQFEANSAKWSLFREDLRPLNVTGKNLTLRLEGTQTPFWLSSCEVIAGQPRKPNVLIYLIDTLRQDHLGVYGYDRDTSPHIDAFAQDALIFTHLTPTSSWTRTSVASLLTGTYPHTHGARHRSAKMRKGMPSLAEAFNQGGYETHAVACNTNVSPEFNIGNQFQHFRSGLAGQIDSDVPLVNELLRIIEFTEGRPWFVYGHAVGPHAPYMSTEKHFELFRSERLTMSEGELQELVRECKRDRWGRFAQMLLLRHRKSVPKFNETKASLLETFSEAHLKRVCIDAYDANIASSDEQFGRLIKGLKDAGSYDNTMIILLSDHGEEFWEHGDYFHGKNLYEEQLRVPFLIKLPRNAHAGGRRTGVVSMVDVAPTLVEMLGLPSQTKFQGTSFVSHIENNTDDARLAFASLLDVRPDRNNNMQMAKDKKGKLIQDLNANSSLWFDLVQDPGEQNPIPAPPYASRLERHVRRISKLRVSGLYLMVRANTDAPTTYTISVTGLNLQDHTVRYAPENGVLHNTQNTLEWKLSFPGPKSRGLLIDRAALLHVECEGTGDFRVEARADSLPLPTQQYHFRSLETMEEDGVSVSLIDLSVEQLPSEAEKPPEEAGIYLWYVSSSQTITTEELSEETRHNLEALGYL